jgi:hypothetical protein
LQNRDREIMNLVTGFGKCGGTLLERCRAEAVIPPPCGDKLDRESTYDAARVAGPGRVFISAIADRISFQLLATAFALLLRDRD